MLLLLPSPVTGAGFEERDGWLEMTFGAWRLAFSQTNGSLACTAPGSPPATVLWDGTNGLWRAVFRDGALRRAVEFAPAGARRFGWALGADRSLLQLSYESAELRLTVEARARDDGADLQATLEPRQGAVTEFGLPAQVRFSPATLQRLVAPMNANESVGAAFAPAFFRAQPLDHPSGWETRTVGSGGYASLYGGSLVFRTDADPKVALAPTAAGATWFGADLSNRIASASARVNRAPAAGQEGTVLVNSANGAYFSLNRLGGAGGLLRIGGGVDEADAPLAASLAVAAIEHLAATPAAGRTNVALIDLERGPAQGWWAAEPVADWRLRLRASPVLAGAGLQLAFVSSVPQLQGLLTGGGCLAVVNPYGEALPVAAPGGLSSMIAALRSYVRAGGYWFETGGHPFYHELTPLRYLEHAIDHPAGFADFLHWETAAGAVSLYGVQPRPFAPWAAGTNRAQMFVPSRLNWGGEASGGHAGRSWVAWVPAGARWVSPAVRVQGGADAWQALQDYSSANGIRRGLRDKLEPDSLARLKQAVLVYYGGTCAEKARYLDLLPRPALIHFADYLHGGFDKEYPDHLPPNAAFGTGSELKAFLARARQAGHLVMPYTNPTWWCDHPRGPTFLREGEAPLLRRLDGSLSYEVYGSNDGYTVCHWHPAVQAANALTVAQFTVGYPVDVLFQDQCGARSWAYDLNPASPDPLAYTEGLVSMAAQDARIRPLATENGWDALVEFETLLCGMTWGIVPTKDAPAWRTFLKDRYPPATWTIFPVAQAIAHDKTLMFHHDLGQFVTDDETLSWTLALGYSLSARLNAPDLAARPSAEWLRWLDRVQKSVCARYAGEPVTAFEHDRSAAQGPDDDGVVRARYGPVSVVGNLGGPPLAAEGQTVAPRGFLAEAPGMRAGLVAAPDAPADPAESHGFVGEFAEGRGEFWVYARTDRTVTLPWPEAVTLRVTAGLDDGSALPASLERGIVRLGLGAPPGVQRVTPPAELAGLAPVQWPNGPPLLGVLDLPGMPSSWTAVSPSAWLTALAVAPWIKDGRVGLTRLTTTNALMAALAAGPPRWLGIVNPCGENFPESGPGQWGAMLDAIRGFVEHGGHWIETGGYSFYVPAWRDGTGWHTEVAGPAALARLGVPVASGPLDRAAESLAPTALGTSLLGAAWAALVQGKTSVVNRALPADTSDPGHLGLLAGSSGDFFGGYRLNGWGGLWRLGGMNPNPETAVPTVAATLEYLATHPPLPPTPGPARYLWHVVVRTHPPRLEDASAASGRFEFQIADCAPHATHAVERSIRWQDPSGWEEVSRFVPQTPAARFAESQPASGPGACYRVRILDGP